MITQKELQKYTIIAGIFAVTVVSFWSFTLFEEAFALEHKVRVQGNFDGKFDHKMINSEGTFRISGDINKFILVGTFDNNDSEHWNPVTGKYVRSNPTCQKIVGDLTLESVETKIKLNVNAKKCQYGLLSYIIGTFDVVDSEGKHDIESGEGRITFVADNHNNSVKGQLIGSFE